MLAWAVEPLVLEWLILNGKSWNSMDIPLNECDFGLSIIGYGLLLAMEREHSLHP
jgi:hypothetical protein